MDIREQEIQQRLCTAMDHAAPGSFGSHTGFLRGAERNCDLHGRI